jgi:hypothetical protein
MLPQRYFLSLITLFLPLFFYSNVNAVNNYTAVDKILAKQETIRVLIDYTSNFGRQTASLNMMNRLWDMGFHGTFELIYPDDNGYYNAKDKMSVLFNLPPDFPAVYQFLDGKKHKIILIGENTYIEKLIAHQVPPIPFGIGGGHDDRTYELPCKKNIACQQYADNLADFTQTNVYVSLPSWFSHTDHYYIKGQAKIYSVIPQGKYWVFPLAKLAETKEYLYQNRSGINLATKIPGLKTLIHGLENKDFNMLPIYGWSFGGSDFPQNILQVLAAARYAQLNGSGEFHKPLVIAVFFEYSMETRELQLAIQQNSWGASLSASTPAEQKVIKSLGLNQANVFLTASILDADITTKLNNLRSGQVMLLSMTKLPKVVFDGLFTHTGSNSWPPICEGESCLHSLLMTGAPYFRCKDGGDDNSPKWEVGFDLVADEALKIKLKSLYADNGFCAKNSWVTSPDNYVLLGKLLIDAKNPQSSLVRYFIDLKQDSQKLENDRIYQGLLAAFKILNSPTATTKS